MASRASIYGLYDEAGNLRYIGKANNPQARLAGHMRDVYRRRTPLYSWIAKHGRPAMKIIEADCDDWREAERRLIAEARARGDNLLNLADGGDEPFASKEVRAENGRKNAAAIHTDPRRKRLWYLKRQLAQSLRDGYGSASLIARMERRPDVFGAILANTKSTSRKEC